VGTTTSKNVFIGDQRTSVRLETVEWEALEEICRDKGWRMRDLAQEVFRTREEGRSFTSAMRVFCLTYFRNKAEVATRSSPINDGLQITSNNKAGKVKNDNVVETTTMPATSPGELL